MSVENEVANLTTSVDNLTEAVNVKKQTLDNSVTAAQTARDTTTGLRDEAATSESAAAQSATDAATSATEAETARDDAVAVVYSGDATLEPAPGSIPVADSDSQITPKWIGSGAYPTIKPSLNLDFANTKSLDPRVDFTRYSTATYYDGQTFAKAEENLLLYSQEFDNSYWDKKTITVTSGFTAPDGTATAFAFANSTDTLEYYARRVNVAPSIANETVYSIFAKAGTANFIGIQTAASGSTSNFSGAVFNLSDGTVGSTYTASASISDIGDGWYRCSFVPETDTGDQFVISIRESDPGASVSPTQEYSGTGKNIYIWGAQLEQRDQVTAYTPTTNQPITNYIPVLQTASTNEPRFDHDPVTGESKGLLIEEQRTNLATRSERLDLWGRTRGVSVSSDAAIAPDGTQTADALVEIADDTYHMIDSIPGYSSIPQTGYFFSFYAKANGRKNIGIATSYEGSGYLDVAFDLIDGVIIRDGGDFNRAYIERVENGWFRVGGYNSSANNGTPAIVLMDDPPNSDSRPNHQTYQGNGYSGFYIWGVQVEMATFPTSYIKTEGSQVTRVADSASISGSNFSEWYRQDEGTILSQWQNKKDNNFGIVEISDGTRDNRIITFVDGSSNLKHRIGYNGVQELNLTDSYVNKKMNFVALTYATNNSGGTSNGDGVTTDSSIIIPTVDRMTIGGVVSQSFYANGYIKRLIYYPKRLPNAVLQTLTEE